MSRRARVRALFLLPTYPNTRTTAGACEARVDTRAGICSHSPTALQLADRLSGSAMTSFVGAEALVEAFMQSPMLARHAGRV